MSIDFVDVETLELDEDLLGSACSDEKLSVFKERVALWLLHLLFTLSWASLFLFLFFFLFRHLFTAWRLDSDQDEEHNSQIIDLH